ncbi:MAG: hypothetical protein HKN87_08755 [Saprospiraceae bacterium]|nr:hypothetical protein [Saprospiraceae bacterium]
MHHDVQIEIYGIRHHGAGSSRNLLAALAQFEPNIILIECPADAQHLLTYIDDAALIPPVAILIYNKKDLKQYAYYPFTVFSPEWQAIRYGLTHQAEVRFFDLPQTHSFLVQDDAVSTKKEAGFMRDPFARMAELAGFDDPELWWDTYIEQQGTAPEVFSAINELMAELRSADLTEKESNNLREAFMRGQLRKARKEGYTKIAVVCGAWHAPALSDGMYTERQDKKLLTGLKKVAIDCTWVPWSYNRIARHTGYSSGVISPYWYEALFTDPDQAVASWMSRASSIMNDMGYSISPAHTIEGSNLAHALALMRQRTWPGISELFDAISSVYCHGDDDLISKMRRKLLEGEKVGEVSDQIPMVPLQKDLERLVKQARLSKDWRKQGAIDKSLDLRKKTQLNASRLLHKLLLLEIPWGEENEPENNPLGNFHEYWTLNWYPDYEILIIEASMWGNTIDEAATNYVLDKINSEKDFEHLGILLYQALHGYLPALVAPISRKIRDLGSVTEDVHLLLTITPPLIWSTRYGDIAKLDISAIETLLDQLFPRICLLLPDQVSNISEESSRAFFTAINRMHQAIQMATNTIRKEQWISTLLQIAKDVHADPLIKGNCLRIMLVKKTMAEHHVLSIVRFELSDLSDPFRPALLIEGFLASGGWLLIHHPALRSVVDSWFGALTDEEFMTYLPIIRRTFGTFHESEKEMIYSLLFEKRKLTNVDATLDETRTDAVLPTLRKLL